MSAGVIDATMPMYAIAPHPTAPNPRACCTDRGWDRDRDLVVHSLVIHESDGRRVELSRADKLDSANGRPVHRGVAAVQLICDDMEDQGLSADQAAALGAALSHAEHCSTHKVQSIVPTTCCAKQAGHWGGRSPASCSAGDEDA